MTHLWMIPLVSLFFAAAIYLLLSPAPLRQLAGLLILANAVSVLILVLGRLAAVAPPRVPAGLPAPDGPVANPVSQALVLFWLVAGLSFLAVLAAMLFRASRDAGAEGEGRDGAGSGRGSNTDTRADPPLNY